jgi:ribosomal protein S12 methylthiotransferase accessory factor
MVRQLFFDATTDLGIPTVYTIQLRDDDPDCGQLVDAATDFDPAIACQKTIRESAAARSVFQKPAQIPENPEDFVSLESGARYLASSARRGEFRFLLESRRLRPLSEMRIDAPADGAGRLGYLVERLRAAGMDAIAVDLTTDEIRATGLWVVRVVIPGLLPMSTVSRARYLGHPRLAPYHDINPAPQPFA